jgi:type III secretion system FlhB-like substrate exporter
VAAVLAAMAEVAIQVVQDQPVAAVVVQDTNGQRIQRTTVVVVVVMPSPSASAPAVAAAGQAVVAEATVEMVEQTPAVEQVRDTVDNLELKVVLE